MINRFLIVAVFLPATSCWQTSLPASKQRSVPFVTERFSHTEDLTGETLADKYLLLSDQQESPSGKSEIFRGYEKCPHTGGATGDQVVIKVSDNLESLRREADNFNRLDDNYFVQTKEYIEPPSQATSQHDGFNIASIGNSNTADCEILQDRGALVMERGHGDLKQYLQTFGPLQGSQLQNIAWTAVKCLQDIHKKGLVWTDLKSQNLVLIPSNDHQYFSIKGIDVESVVLQNENPIDYTPRFAPPEFAVRYLCGSEIFMEMEANFDIWSLGMLLHEMATGTHFFEGKEHIEVATELKNSNGLHDLVNDLSYDPALQDLVGWCLQLEPGNRPTIEQVAQHPYFTLAEGDNSNYAMMY